MTIFVTKHFEPPEIVCAEKSFLVQIREGLNFAQFLPRIYTFVFVICYKKVLYFYFRLIFLQLFVFLLIFKFLSPL